jgi:enoyl-CoA hydratase/carnithine racemase
MSTPPVAVEHDGPLAIITMQFAPYNLLSVELMDGVLGGLDEAEQAGARAVLLRSGLKHFCAGADITMFDLAMEGGAMAISPVEFLRRFESFPLPVVAAVHGTCVGGGLELALACDLIFASRTAKIGSVEVTLGLNPLMGAVQRQVQRAGSLRAKEMSMLGRRYDAETLERWNLVNRVLDDEHLDDASRTVGLELANGPTIAHRITKDLARIAADEGVAAADAAMEELHAALWTSEDLRIGMDSFRSNGPGLARFVGR